MTNLVEFTLKLRDLMSGGMQKAAAITQNSFKGIDTQVARTQQGIANTGRTISNVAQQARSAAGDFDKLNRSMDNASRRRSWGGGGFGGGGLGSMLAGIGVTAGIGSVINTGLQAQAQKTSFEVMAGAGAGSKLYGDLTKYAQDSIYGNEVYKMAQTQLAFGANANSVMPTLKMIGDIAMGDEQKLQSLNLAYSQIRATGRLMGQDLQQLVNAGFNPLQIISEKTGKSMAALKEDMEKGRISFNMVENAFVSATSAGGKFYQMTEKIAQTDYGKLAKFKGDLEALALQVGGALAPAFGRFLTEYATPFIAWVSKAVIWVRENWNWLKLWTGAILSVAAGLKAMSIAQGALNLVMLANPVVLFVGALVALAGICVSLYGKVQFVTNAVDGLASTFEGIIGIIKTVTTLIYSFFTSSDPAKTFQQGGYEHGKAYTEGMMKAAEEFSWFDFLRKAMGTHDHFQNKHAGFDAYAGKKLAELAASENALLAPKQKAFNGSAFGQLWNKWANPTGSLASSGAADNGSSSTFQGISTRTGDSVIGGGARPINVTVHKFFDDIHLHAQTMQEGVDDFERKVVEVMLRTMQSLKAV